jgi:hypothetical protein
MEQSDCSQLGLQRENTGQNSSIWLQLKQISQWVLFIRLLKNESGKSWKHLR